ncbi:hypothetical protein [Streptomyces cyaneofuscatus]|uniref:hypothetical protein n=1 Tax=Streptomyces cyaneofuscatus TaxID=66883 RepID=UPI0037FB3341
MNQPPPEAPMRRWRTVCLIKGCTGSTTDIRSWNGVILLRRHEHDPAPTAPHLR